MEIKIVLNGAEQTLTQDQLFALAANGTIRPDTNISIDGQLLPAIKVKGLVFGKSTNYQTPVSSPLPPSSPNSAQNDFPPPAENIRGNNPFAEFSQQTPQQDYTGNFPPTQPYPQYNQYPAQNPAAGNGKAIASLVCGILSVILCGGFLILPLIGLILGVLGSKSKKQGLALAGIVLCGFSLFLTLIISVALFLPVVPSGREAARRMTCVNNQKNICIAFHNFHDTHHAFPALYTVDENGQPLHSWRVLILPFLREEVIRLDEPWDSEYNRQFHSRMPSAYACPSNGLSISNKTADQCCYSAIAGKGWNNDKTQKDKEGILTPAEKAGTLAGTTYFNLITDGLSNTFLVIEVKEPFCWMNPTADKTFNDLEKIGTEHSSFHPGGFNGVFGDGSVRFISNTIDPYILNALGTRDGGEPISPP
ncbi:MAG: DUF1559 domain-containing protein [Planctomycetaceae bacterium]|jgi:prepilin-type processing-associated H-X9-DG protein|nr:DUF1559 domain-containing protein [Planctomycetaceae bacterium]